MAKQLLCDRYEIQYQLGKNVGRYTFLAQDLQTQQQVVIKVLNFGPTFEWQDLKLFEREAETLKALSHSAIPRYLDFFDLDLPKCKGFALIQTYIEAQSLRDWLKAGRRFSETEIRQIAKALLELLIYLHNSHPPIIHRDIKASNILVTNRSGHSVGEVYLVDFGSVQTVSNDLTRTVVGSYGYMPPEQFGGRSVAASDLYSLGATLVELITGRHPADLLKDDMQIDLAEVSINPVFKGWLKWLTQPSTQHRPQSAQLALNALDARSEIRSEFETCPVKQFLRYESAHRWTTESIKHFDDSSENRAVIQEFPKELRVGILIDKLVRKRIGVSIKILFAAIWNTLSFRSFFITNLELHPDHPLRFFLFLFFCLGILLSCSSFNSFKRAFCLEKICVCIGRSSTKWHYFYKFLGIEWSDFQNLDPIHQVTYALHDGYFAGKLSLKLGRAKKSIEGLDGSELRWVGREISDWLGIKRDESLRL